METSVEQCPLCDTELSKTKFREIQLKLREEEQRKAAEIAQAEAAIRQRLEKELKLDFEKQKKAVEKKAREEAEQELKKVAAERDQAAKKLKEAQDREAGIRKQAEQEIAKQKQAAEKKANEDAEAKIKKVAAERDQIAKKLKDAQDREAEILKQAQEEAEKQRQKELAAQRQALEKDKTLTLLKQEAKFNREREAVQKKVQLMEKQLQKRTANELGDGAEIDLFEALRESFSGDRINRIPKGQAGADILHEVLHKGESCGRIIIDSKNRQSWQNGFVTKLRQDQVEAGAEHAILASNVFPAGKKEMCIESAVIVIAPARVVHMVQVLRKAMVAMHVMGLSLKERSSKMTRLYKLVTSESYSGKFSEAGQLARDILELDVQEKKTHDNVWKKRGTLATRINNVLREVETDVAAVIEGSDENEMPPAFPVKSAGGDGAGAKIGEVAAWSKH
jgi:chemotaxis protein histidine kinase CheA